MSLGDPEVEADTGFDAADGLWLIRSMPGSLVTDVGSDALCGYERSS